MTNRKIKLMPFETLKQLVFESIQIHESQQNVIGTLVINTNYGKKEFPIFQSSSSYGISMGEDRFSSSWSNVKIDNLQIDGIPEFSGKLDYKLDLSKRHVKFIFVTAAGKVKSMVGVKGGAQGQSDGEAAEPLVAYLYNNLDSIHEDLSDKWKESSEKIASFIDTMWSHDNYVAAHVNGRDMENIPEVAKDVAKIFFSKSDAEKVLDLDPRTLKDLYIGAKDNWNKADIVLVNNTFDLNELGNISTGSQLNVVLTELAKGPEPRIVPISLKAIDPNKKILVVPEGFDTNENYKTANKVELVLPKKFVPNSNNGSCYLKDNNGRLIQFRVQTPAESDNLSIEVSLGANARGGKGITKIKSDLGLTGKDWYAKEYTKDEVLKYFSNDFNVSNDSLNALENLTDENDTNPWWNRTCFRGLINLYLKYSEKYKSANAENFFDWIYDKSSLGTGAFYLIYN